MAAPTHLLLLTQVWPPVAGLLARGLSYLLLKLQGGGCPLLNRPLYRSGIINTEDTGVSLVVGQVCRFPPSDGGRCPGSRVVGVSSYGAWVWPSWSAEVWLVVEVWPAWRVAPAAYGRTAARITRSGETGKLARGRVSWLYTAPLDLIRGRPPAAPGPLIGRSHNPAANGRDAPSPAASDWSVPSCSSSPFQLRCVMISL